MPGFLQPLDSSGYMKVKLESPELFLRCRPKSFKLEPCLWILIELNANVGSAKTVAWHVPAGNDAHTNIVATATFASALICALSVFVFTIYFSKNFVQVPPVFWGNGITLVLPVELFMNTLLIVIFVISSLVCMISYFNKMFDCLFSSNI